MDIDPKLALSAIGIIGTLGAAWGGARVALNGTRERVKQLSKDLKDHIEHDHTVQLETVDRLARIETKLDRVLDDRSTP